MIVLDFLELFLDERVVKKLCRVVSFFPAGPEFLFQLQFFLQLINVLVQVLSFKFKFLDAGLEMEVLVVVLEFGVEEVQGFEGWSLDGLGVWRLGM